MRAGGAMLPRLHLGHTPVYVLLFEGLVAAALPLLTLGCSGCAGQW